MKNLISLFLVSICIVSGSCAHLRTVNHQFVSLSDLAPSQLSNLFNGNLGSILPSSLQSLVGNIFSQEQSAGSSGFLSKIQGLIGGGSSSSGGLLGGLGNLFGQASSSGSSGASSILNSFSGALGGSGSSLGLPNLSDFTSGLNFGGITNGLNGAAANLNGQASSSGLSGLLNSFSHEGAQQWFKKKQTYLKFKYFYCKFVDKNKNVLIIFLWKHMKLFEDKIAKICFYQ